MEEYLDTYTNLRMHMLGLDKNSSDEDWNQTFNDFVK